MTEIRHTGLVTKNIKKSLLFWTKYLKFKIYKEMDEEGDLIDKIMLYKNVKLKTFKLKDKNNNLLELLYFKNSPKKNFSNIMPYTTGFTHISVTVKNLNLIYKRLIKKKIRFNSKPQKSSDGNVLMTYCKTPEGAYLELVQEL
tara:strand:+ start:2107 stop:2535 length:429 start_codon:yes stop_codon:yes gene_type:complete